MKRKFFSALLCAMISFCLIVSSAACVPEENKEPDDGGPPIVTPQPDDDKDNETPGEDPDGEGDPSGEGSGEDETPDEEPPSESGLVFTMHADGKAYYVSGIGACTDTEIVIPDYYNGLPVTNIGGSAFKGTDIQGSPQTPLQTAHNSQPSPSETVSVLLTAMLSKAVPT